MGREPFRCYELGETERIENDKIDSLLRELLLKGYHRRTVDVFVATTRGKIRELFEELGYRKIEGEPPLAYNPHQYYPLSVTLEEQTSNINHRAHQEGAVSQRDLDIKWYKGEK